MPRSSGGTYTLPSATNPVVAGTTIQANWANTTLADVASELTDSASRSGKGGFTAPIRGADGSAAAPSHSFTGETGSGLYRAGAGDVRLAVSGADALEASATGITVPGTLTVEGSQVGAVADGASAVAHILDTANPLVTAGAKLLSIRNAGSEVAYLDYAGSLSFLTTWETLTLAGDWAGTLQYALVGGVVHLRGVVTAGVAAANPIATLPVGFRPSTVRAFSCVESAGGTYNAMAPIQVDGTGAIQPYNGFIPTAGRAYFLDGISFGI